MTDNQEHYTVLSVDDWTKRWEDRDIGFHKSEVHRFIQKHNDKLINGRENIRILFPLCGKSVDMKWAYDQGHTVIGVDGSRMALEEFFEEQGIKYSVLTKDEVNGELFESEDKRIKLYRCDFYLFNSSLEGKMDAIWDRGSLVAINRDDRKKYADMMIPMMAPECQYLLETFHYDETKYGGPPHYVSEEAIKTLFGDKLNIQQIEKVDITAKKHLSEWKVEKVESVLYQMTLK